MLFPEPPEPCLDCQLVIGPRAQRFAVEQNSDGRDLFVCLSCYRKREKRAKAAETRKPDLVDWIRVRRGARS